MRLKQYLSSNLIRRPHAILIGNPISHSLSPVMHNTAASHLNISLRYGAVEVKQNELSELIASLNKETLQGANVTIPYKNSFLDIVDELTPEAQEIEAVNTLFKENGQLIGDNTDAYGFARPIHQLGYDLVGERAIIFGTGGATKAIVHVLKEMGVAEIVLVSRSRGQRSLSDTQPQTHIQLTDYSAWRAYAEDASIIINATPLGMSPKVGESPVQSSETSCLSGKICYDIVYNPLETKFLKQAGEAGAETIGGIEMLIHQGSRSFKRWTGCEFPVSVIRKKLMQHF